MSDWDLVKLVLKIAAVVAIIFSAIGWLQRRGWLPVKRPPWEQ